MKNRRGCFRIRSRVVFTVSVWAVAGIFLMPAGWCNPDGSAVVRERKTVEAFMEELEAMGTEPLTLEKLAEAQELNMRLDAILAAEQKYAGIRKLRSERTPRLPVIGSPSVSAPVLPGAATPEEGYGIQRIYRRGGVIMASLLDSRGHVWEVRKDSMLPGDLRVASITRDSVGVTDGRKDKTLPFLKASHLPGGNMSVLPSGADQMKATVDTPDQPHNGVPQAPGINHE